MSNRANSASSKQYFNPASLYNIAVSVTAENYQHLQYDLHVFPAEIHFDIIYDLYENNHLTELIEELTNYEIFIKILRGTSKRLQLHRTFQATMNSSICTHTARPSEILTEIFVKKFVNAEFIPVLSDQLISQGLCISTFFSEAGWLKEAECILQHCRQLLLESKNSIDKVKLVECFQRLLHVQNGYCQFVAAEKTYREALEFTSNFEPTESNPNLALLYSEFSALYMLRSNYEQAYEWSVKSLFEVVPKLHRQTLIDVYRQTAKSCVLKRQFKKAGFLIKEACKLSRRRLKPEPLKYADTLIDFGFYLLNVDAISQGIEVYQLALHIRQTVFSPGSKNLHVATAHEDLAYASYVYNYSNGLFQDARNQAEKAISLLLCLLPSNHLLLSSCKRVKALILEEMAIENTDKDIEAKYLEEAHTLHTEALRLALDAFGEMNVQTAKHYGNLGRLYQSMKKFKNAEEMHLKAITIKETLLGPNDYEVALSIGHLASLYNYDLGYYTKAEMLYLRSIEIGKKLFGDAYSGLEYDYRGLLRVYTSQFEMEKRLRYINILSCWKAMREQMETIAKSPFSELTVNEPHTTVYVIGHFTEL